MWKNKHFNQRRRDNNFVLCYLNHSGTIRHIVRVKDCFYSNPWLHHFLCHCKLYVRLQCLNKQPYIDDYIYCMNASFWWTYFLKSQSVSASSPCPDTPWNTHSSVLVNSSGVCSRDQNRANREWMSESSTANLFMWLTEGSSCSCYKPRPRHHAHYNYQLAAEEVKQLQSPDHASAKTHPLTQCYGGLRKTTDTTKSRFIHKCW